MKKTSFGKAKLEDAIRISVLLKTVYIETYAAEGITFEFANFIEKRFSKGYIEKIIRENPHQFLIAYFDTNPIGVAEVLFESNCPVRNIVVPELSKLYVLKRFFGKGIGYGLMMESEKLLKEKGYQEFNIEVYVGNARAISFYERQGYQKIGNVDFRMEQNVYDNFVMNKSFLPNAQINSLMKETNEPIIVEELLDTSLEKVWSAITEANQMRQWFFEQIEFFEPKVGFEISFLVQIEDRKFTHLWKVVEVIDQQKIVYHWRYQEYPGNAVVTFELSEVGGNVRLILTAAMKENFPDHIPEFKREVGVQGWNYLIKKSLKKFVGGD